MMVEQLKTIIQNLNQLTMAATPPTLPHANTPMPELPTKTRRPKPAMPADFDRDWKKGLTFLHSCQTYICLCPEEF